MEFKSISTHGSQTSSPVTVNGVALNGVLSAPLPVQAGVPQGSVLGPLLFLVFINDLSDSLENPLYFFADESTLCHTICLPSDWQAAASTLSTDLGNITNWSNT